jgi:hypothetical protein
MNQNTHITRVVDESGEVSTLGGVYNPVLVDSEEVTRTNASLLIVLLSFVGNLLTNNFTNVLNNL